MTKKHSDELTLVSQASYDYSMQKFTDYCVKKYSGDRENSMEDQLEDLCLSHRKRVFIFWVTRSRFWNRMNRRTRSGSFVKICER